jgi:hypothetical protein
MRHTVPYTRQENMKVTYVAALCLLGLVIIVKTIIPAIANLLLGMGLEMPNSLAHYRNTQVVYLYPWALLLFGLLLVGLISYGVWRLLHG